MRSSASPYDGWATKRTPGVMDHSPHGTFVWDEMGNCHRVEPRGYPYDDDFRFGGGYGGGYGGGA